MNSAKGWKIATIRGIALKLHVSLLFILFYVVLVASAQFPYVARRAGVDTESLVGGPLGWGLVFAVALFTSVVLHELGHAFVAQSMGIKVKGITLMMLGGMSEMEQMPEGRLQEFKVAVVGPLVSFAIAGTLYFLESRTQNSNVALFSHWLGRANLFLAIFNLLPAFPLDGGRVLRSALAVRQGNLKATQTSVAVGKVFAWAFGILGFIQFNILLMLIALFLYMAANSELAIVLEKNSLRGFKVKNVARHTAVISEGALLAHVAEEMLRSKNLTLPVQTASGHPATVSISDIRRVPNALRLGMRVSAVMERVPKALKADDELDKVFSDFMVTRAGALPYEEGGRLSGIVLYSDVTQMLQFKELEKESQPEKGKAA